jgi:DNA-binding transcriptional MerR regulator
MLTIAQFADRTGITPSALRFYERKGLLQPAQRRPNGYRVYTAEQVAEAQLINSLRQADVSVEFAARLLTIQLAGQYLQGLQPDQPQIYLHRWEEPSVLLWFPATGPVGPLPFAAAITDHAQSVDRLGLSVLSGGHARTLDVVGGQVIGEVGFRLAPRKGPKAPAGARLQAVEPTLFATLECLVDDDKAAHRVFRFLHQFGYRPSGLSLERYIPGVTDRYQLLIAVAQA